jgi:hypothetical protein
MIRFPLAAVVATLASPGQPHAESERWRRPCVFRDPIEEIIPTYLVLLGYVASAACAGLQ